MKVKEIIIDAMNLIGRSDAAEAYSSDSTDGEVSRLAYTMLFCYNAVTDELARGYFPIKATEYFHSSTRLFAFDKFTYTPVKILKVTSDEKRIKWRISATQLQTESADIKVEYNYTPKRCTPSDDFSYGNMSVSERLVALGMAAEYFIICGEVESALLWESKYRDEIERQMSLVPVKERIPPRRWL